MRRTQIYLEDEQAARLDRRAAEAGATRSEMIREAIEAWLGPSGPRWTGEWHDTLEATAGVAPYLGEDHVARLREAGAQRLTEMEGRGSG